MSDKPYVEADLIDYADLGDGWNAGWTREEAINNALPDDALVSFKRSGRYQGEYALVVLLDDCIWVETGSYGSCSGCDAFQRHREEEAKRILRDAYCFKREEDLETWMDESESLEMSYGGAREPLGEALSEVRESASRTETEADDG